LKLMFKEVIVPTQADRALYLLAAGAGDDAGAGGLGGDPVLRPGWCWPMSTQACCT